MNKKITVSVALAITIIAMTVTFAITWLVSLNVFGRTMSSVNELQAQYGKVAELDNYIRHNFYGEIDENFLNDRIAAGYVAGLNDRYSVYYTEQEYATMVRTENGELVGVGIEVVREADGSYRIARVYEGSPAAQAGLAKNATILKVDGADAASFSGITALRSALMGEQGTSLELVCSYGLTQEESTTVRRINYTAPTVERRTLGEYAYIRIHAIGANTFTDFDYEVRQALNENVKGLVFDVRGINGVLYRQVYDMIDILCPRGTVAKSENLNGTVSVLATSDDNAVDIPMVVIVDGNTAASAELFAISLRDMAGAQIVGVKTTGHGTLQSQPYRLSDGSAVAITVSRLLTGRDESYDGTGITPNIEAPAENVTEAMLFDPVPEMDNQIRRAFEVVRAMVRERGIDPGSGSMTSPSSSSSSQPAAPSSGSASSQPEDGSGSGSGMKDDSATGDDSTSGDGGTSGSSSSRP